MSQGQSDKRAASATSYHNRGEAFRANGQKDEAIADFTTAITLKPDYVILYHSRGATYFEKGDYDMAIADCTQAIEIYGGDGNPWTYLVRGKVMEIIEIQPFKGKVVDPRWYNVTIGHLLTHKGGWDRKASIEFDPVFRSLDIQSEMGLKGPPDSKDVIAYMMSRPLDFNPGEKYAYSNFGYAILGRVIEKISGKTYFEYLKHTILIPIGIYDMELARSLPKDRSPKEIQVYYHPGKVRSVFSSAWVFPPDGGFYIEAMDSYGGLIASAADLVKFSQKYWLRGGPRLPGQTGEAFIYGALDGTYSCLWWRADGINVAILLNQRIGSVDYFPGMSGEDIDSCYAPLKSLVDAAINAAL